MLSLKKAVQDGTLPALLVHVRLMSPDHLEWFMISCMVHGWWFTYLCIYQISRWYTCLCAMYCNQFYDCPSYSGQQTVATFVALSRNNIMWSLSRKCIQAECDIFRNCFHSMIHIWLWNFLTSCPHNETIRMDEYFAQFSTCFWDQIPSWHVFVSCPVYHWWYT